MKSVPLGMVGLAIIASGLFMSHQTFAQDEDHGPQPVASYAISANLDYGNDAVVQPGKHNTDFDVFGLWSAQEVTITVQFPVEWAGQMILVEPLDGGTVTIPEDGLFADAQGNVSFQFQAGDEFGACRISVHQPNDSNFVQFWIVDPDHPENSPQGLPGPY